MKKLCRLGTTVLTSLLVLLCASAAIFTVSAEDDYFILGDVTGDEVITQEDADTMLDGVAGRIRFTQKQKYAADVTCDGKVDMQDVYTLLKYIAGKSHNAYIGKKFYICFIQSVKLNKTNITLNVSESDNLSVITTPYYDNVTVRWYSSDSSVVSVSTDGKIEAKGAGRATITAETYNGKTAACEVNVKASEETVTVSSTSVTLGVGESYTIQGLVNGKANSSKINWISNNSVVAEVENNGSSAVIKANNKGTATITAQLPNGNSATCKVTVKSAPSSVAITPSSLTLGAGEGYTISQSTNSGSYAKGFTWSSSNTSVATVTKTTANKAKIMAKRVGTATVTVKLYNGKTSTCKVTVKKAPSSVTIKPNSLTLGTGESYTISQSTNSGSYAKGFTWSSSNTSVATVTKTTANKAKITTKGVGTATITVKLYNGKTSTCKVTVKKSPSSVTIKPNSLTLGAGESYTISQSTNSGSYAKGFTWSSSNTSVATVTKTTANKAKVTAKGVGTATVTVKLYNGKTSTCKVTVVKKLSTDEKVYKFQELNEYKGKIYYSIREWGRSNKINTDQNLVVPLPDSIKNTAGEFTFFNNYIYYMEKYASCSDAKKTVYRCRMDGSNIEYLFSTESTQLAIYRNKIYCSSYRENSFVYDITSKKMSALNGKISVNIWNNRCYFYDYDKGMLAYRDLGTNKITYLTIMCDSGFYIDSNYLYYLDSNYNKLYRLDLKTNKKEQVLQKHFELKYAYRFVISDGYMYVCDSSNTSKKINLKTGKEFVLPSNHNLEYESFSYSVGDYVYYYGREKQTITWRCYLLNKNNGVFTEIGTYSSPSA